MTATKILEQTKKAIKAATYECTEYVEGYVVVDGEALYSRILGIIDMIPDKEELND